MSILGFKEAQLIKNSMGSLRRLYAWCLSTAAAKIAKFGVHPNTVTLVSLVPAALAGVAAAVGIFWLAGVLLLLSGCFDVLDGALARQTGQSSRFGALLDSTVDRLSDTAVPVGLLLFYAPFGFALLVPAFLILSGFSISYVRARAEGLSFTLPRLWMRREDRLFITVIALLLAGVPLPGLPVPAPVTFIILGVLATLGFVAMGMALRVASDFD